MKVKGTKVKSKLRHTSPEHCMHAKGRFGIDHLTAHGLGDDIRTRLRTEWSYHSLPMNNCRSFDLIARNRLCENVLHTTYHTPHTSQICCRSQVVWLIKSELNLPRINDICVAPETRRYLAQTFVVDQFSGNYAHLG